SLSGRLRSLPSGLSLGVQANRQPLLFLHRDDHDDAAPVLFDEHRFCTRGVDHRAESILRLPRRHGFHFRSPWRSIAPFRTKWFFFPTLLLGVEAGSSVVFWRSFGRVLRNWK